MPDAKQQQNHLNQGLGVQKIASEMSVIQMPKLLNLSIWIDGEPILWDYPWTTS